MWFEEYLLTNIFQMKYKIPVGFYCFEDCFQLKPIFRLILEREEFIVIFNLLRKGM